MRNSFILLAAGIAAVASSGIGLARAENYPGTDISKTDDVNHNLIGLSTPNGRLAWNFVNMWFNQSQGLAAWDKYVARQGFVNRAVYSSTTQTENDDFATAKAKEVGAPVGPGGPRPPSGVPFFQLKQIVTQGDLVFMHIWANQPSPQALAAAAATAQAIQPRQNGDGKGGDEMLEIVRVHGGKIVDHWDIHVPMNSNSIVFSGLDRQLPYR